MPINNKGMRVVTVIGTVLFLIFILGVSFLLTDKKGENLLNAQGEGRTSASPPLLPSPLNNHFGHTHKTRKLGNHNEKIDVKITESLPVIHYSQIDKDLNSLGREEIIETITKLTNFSQHALNKIPDIQEFSNKLYNTYLGENKSDENVSDEIYFSYDTDINHLPLNPTSLFFIGQPVDKFITISASFRLESIDSQFVMVRWVKDDVNVILYDRYIINPDTDYNFIKLKRNDWLPGEYKVEIYTADEKLSKLVEGGYRVN